MIAGSALLFACASRADIFEWVGGTGNNWSTAENWVGAPPVVPPSDGSVSILFSSTADPFSTVSSTIDAPWHIQGISLSGVNDMDFNFSGSELTVGSGGFSQTPLSSPDADEPYAYVSFDNNLKLSASSSFASGNWETWANLDIGNFTLTISEDANLMLGGTISGTGGFELDGGTLDLSVNLANPITADMEIVLTDKGGTLIVPFLNPEDLDLSVFNITGTGDLALGGVFNSDSFLPGHTGDTILGGDGCGCDSFPATWTVGDARPALPPGRITINDMSFLELRGHSSFTLNEGILGSGFVALGSDEALFATPGETPPPGGTLTFDISGTTLHTASILPSVFVGMEDLEDFDDQGSVVKTGAGTLQIGAGLIGAKFDLEAGSVELVAPVETDFPLFPPGQITFLGGVNMSAGTTLDLNDVAANIGGPQGGLNGAAGSLIKIGNPTTEEDIFGDPLPNLMITAESNFAGDIMDDESVSTTSGSVLISAPPGAVVTFSGDNTYTGGTTVESGVLKVTGTMVSPITLLGCDCEVGILSGNGQVGGLTIEAGGMVAPGNSAGTLTVAGDSVWNNDGAFEMEIDQTSGTPGVAWDLLFVTGSLDLSGLNTGEFSIQFSLLTPDEEFNFGDEWTFATAGGGITGFEADDFVVEDGGFAASLGGKFGVIQDGSNLNLTFTPVPEPSDYAVAFGLGLLGFAAWRKRRQAAARPALV